VSFTSLQFLLFLPAVFVLYWSLRRSLRLQNLLLVAASYVFYGWWDYRFLLLIVLTTLASYLSGLGLEYFEGRNRQRRLVAAANIIFNLAILALLFLGYNWFGEFLPGLLGHNGFTLKRVLITQFWGTQGVLGTGIGVSATYIFLFVVFGAFLKHSGFSKFINDFSLTLVGQTPGGPAKVAVVASALMGMINGSAIANVATTGTITIPLMKRTGYRKEFAGAVEAVASTGGQFCPPIMGAVGFVMAEFLNLSYTKVMLAAIVPAFLYYLGLLMSVHFEARRLGLSGLARENIPDAVKVIKNTWIFVIGIFFPDINRIQKAFNIHKFKFYSLFVFTKFSNQIILVINIFDHLSYFIT